MGGQLVIRQLLNEFIPGHAKTKGSIDTQRRRDGSTRVVQNVKGSVAWAHLVEHRLRQAWGEREARTGVAIRMTITYWLPVTPARLLTQGSGDIDKLERNILDAVTKAGIYHDDAQVVGVVHEKIAALDEARGQVHAPGVQVTLYEVVTE